MSYRQESSSARAGQFIISILFLALLLGACVAPAPLPRATTQPETPSMPTLWNETASPLFPAEWPPTADTVWVRYTFAYGTNPTKLMDGAYVTLPLTKIEWREGQSTTTVLRSDKTEAGVQGVRPLDAQTRTILESGQTVSDYCQSLTALPDPALPETAALLAYYRAWFANNGAFLGFIRGDHAGFIDWVTGSK